MAGLSTEAMMRLLVARVPDIARRAVAVPTKRLGTVTDDGIEFINVTVDGDDSPTSLLNATGQLLLAGQRVVVEFYPPHGAMVAGILTPQISLEQTFTVTFSVTSAGPTGASTTNTTTWTELSTAGFGWTVAGGLLRCDLAGEWALTTEVGFASSGAGTHRAALMALALAGGGESLHAQVSHQFVPQGTQPTAGYGLSGSGWGRIAAAEGETLSTRARQDTGAALNCTVIANLRMMTPT